MRRSILYGIIILVIALIITYPLYRNIHIRKKEVEKKESKVLAPPLNCIPRKVISLNGTWEIAKGGKTPPKGGWKTINIPTFISSFEYPYSVWFRKRFSISSIPPDDNVFIRFYGVKFHCIIYVNGHKVGEHWDGFSPFMVNITNVVKYDSENELLVFVEDWRSMLQGVNKESAKDVYDLYDAVVYPIGSQYTNYGIWDSVEVVVLPKVWISDVFVMTSVRLKNITIRVEVRNDDIFKREIVVVNKIYDHGRLAKELKNITVTISAKSSLTVNITEGWEDPHLWSPDDPHLYVLKTIIVDKNGNVIDEKRTRFGFREFWIVGDSFYLNGKHVILRATGCHPLSRNVLFNKTYVKDLLKRLKEYNVIAIRFHAQPWPRIWYDAADEVGMLVIHESAVWCFGTIYKLDYVAFWDHFKEHLITQVKLHRNNPSIVIWSLENELLLTGGTRYQPTISRLAQLARIVKSIDPTRPIMFEGDEDPLGAADIINLHYPHEFPNWDNYPNTAYWLDKPVKLDSYPRKVWMWKRDKPLYIGEFLWISPSSYNIAATFLGEIAYEDFHKYYIVAKGLAWKMQIEAYRYYRVSGFCPWSMIEAPELWNIVKEAYAPITAFVREYDTRFFEGDVVTRTITIYNDVLHSSNLTFKCMLTYANGSVIQGETKELSLKPGSYKRYVIKLIMPKVRNETKVYLKLNLYEGSELVFNDTKEYVVYPKEAIRADLLRLKIGLYDPIGCTKKIFDENNIKYEFLNTLDDLKNIDVLVIGYQAISNNTLDLYRDDILRFIKSGGSVIIFEQKVLPNWLPIKLKVTKHNSTIAFTTLPPSPIFKGIPLGSLKFWRGDHIVSKYDIVKPVHGNFRPLVVSGYGLRYSPVLEIYYGKGRILICQLVVTEKYGKDPIATKIYNNILEYYASDRRVWKTKEVLVVTRYDSTLERALKTLGVSFKVASSLEDVDLEPYSIVIIDDISLRNLTSDECKKLVTFMNNGGYVVLHYVSNDSVDILRTLGVNISVRKSPSLPPVFINRTEINAGMTNDLFYWIEKVTGRVIKKEESSAEIANRALIPIYKKDKLLQEIYPNDMQVVCPAYSKSSKEIGLWTEGYAEFSINVDKDGMYILEVLARGTPAEGEYPIMEIRLDNKKVDAVIVSSESYKYYDIAIDLTKGRHKIALAFTNDLWLPEKGEDRNLYIGKARLFQAKVEMQVLPLTRPCLLAIKHIGKGELIIDQVPWDYLMMGEIEAGDLDKALRYASILLTNLGVEMNTSRSITMSASEMRIKNVSAYRILGDEVDLFSNGYIGDYIEFKKAGKYGILIVARGTPAASEYPIMEVRLNGKTICRIHIKSVKWMVYGTTIDIKEPGLYKLELAFINDYSVGGEDRNLYLKFIMISYEG